jgi:hypothetical protein
MNVKFGENIKSPIQPVEIDQMRERVQIGDVFWLGERDPWKAEVAYEEKYTVVAKYKHFCVVRNKKGKERSIKYVDMLLQERQQVREIMQEK